VEPFDDVEVGNEVRDSYTIKLHQMVLRLHIVGVMSTQLRISERGWRSSHVLPETFAQHDKRNLLAKFDR
jgi:hypothetical protein